MSKIYLLIALSMHTTFLEGQSQWSSFTYTAPSGYKVIDKGAKLHLEKNVGKHYGQLFIYPSENTSGDAATCFEQQWNFFARNAEQGVGDPETRETEILDGWTYTFGAARGNFNGQMFAITLSSRFKDGVTYFVATVVSDKQFLADAQAFTNSVKPIQAVQAKVEANPTNKSGNGAKQPSVQAKGGISTTFSDGWTSTYVGPYVALTKDDQMAWIFPVNDSLDKINRKPEEYLEDKYWRYAVDRFFLTKNVAERPWQMSGPGNDKIFEAEVKHRLTGEISFVAMRVIWNSGRAQPVLAFAATKELMYKGVFANYNSFEQVLSYNKFMPSPATIRGTWQSAEVGATGSYVIAGGFQGGNAKVSFKDEFIFNADGSYQSQHALKQRNESTGEGYVQKHRGSFTLLGTSLQLTNRRADDSGDFECWMEAVNGGLALILVNKKFTGQRYTLLRIN